MVEVASVNGNPSSLHHAGRAARRVLEDARDQVAYLLDADPAEVIWTSGGTEANNLAVHGSWLARRAERPRVVIGAAEHPAVFDQATVIEAEGGLVDWASVNQLGHTEPFVVEPDTAIVSVMWVNNETGAIQPITELAEQAHRAGAWFHTDAVQALPALPVSFRASGADFLTASAHKVGGPIGIGALVATRAVSPTPVLVGGGQERGVRSGTLSPVLAAGFAAALTEAVEQRDALVRHWTMLTNQLRAGLSSIADTWVNSADPHVPTIMNVTFAGCIADDVLLLLDAAGIDCSVGSACAAGVSRASHVLLAMGRPEADARGSLRFSFGAETSEADIARLIAALPDAVRRARAVAQ